MIGLTPKLVVVGFSLNLFSSGFRMGLPRGLDISRKRDSRGIRRRSGEREVMTLSLVPLDVSTTKRMLHLSANRDQVAWYWGSGLASVGRIYESVALTFLGVWLCYFMAYLAGSSVTSAVGGVFLSHFVMAPILVAYFKNKELRGNLAEQGGNDVGTRAAIFFGKVAKFGIEKHEKRGYFRDPGWYRMDLQDERGRTLAIRAPFVDSYRHIALGMSCQVLVISNDIYFRDIVGVSDAYVPAVEVWVGSFPYLNKDGFRQLIHAVTGTKQNQMANGKDDSSFTTQQGSNANIREQGFHGKGRESINTDRRR